MAATTVKVHCGGCGYKHERTELEQVGPYEDPRNALTAAGMRSGFVGLNAEGWAIFAGRCCRDVREALDAEGLGPYGNGKGRSYFCVNSAPAEQEQAAATEAHYERLYASAYGLGL